jgi:monoamine oxidase
MKKEEHDMTLGEFLQKHYSGEECSDFRQHIRNYAEGFDLADVAKASMKALYIEWSNEDKEIYRVSGGYRQLITHLLDESKKKNAEILLNSVVTEVNWEKGKVSVRTKDGKQYNGEKCIVTVPLPFLQKINAGSIVLNSWPVDRINASREIGYSTVVKVVLEFNKSFWNSYAEHIGFIISDEEIPTWWTQLPDSITLLTGWKGGPGAADMSNKSEEEILRIALHSLATLFKMSVEELREMLVASAIFNWLTEEYVEGAYSYSYPSSAAAKKILNKDLDETVFFAGEALGANESSGTVEAALISGREVATKLRKLNRLKKIGARIEIQPRF